MTEQYTPKNINPSVTLNSRTVDQDGRANLDDDLVQFDTASGPISFDLANAGQEQGQTITLKSLNAGTTGNPITISPVDDVAANPAGEVVLDADGQCLVLKSNNEGWKVVSFFGSAADACDPSIPELSIVSTTSTPGTRTNALSIQGGIAWVSDFGSGPGTFNIVAYEISDPSNLRQISVFNNSTPPTVNNTYRLVAQGNYLYVAVNSRLMIYDISDPANPVRLSLIGAGSQAFDIAVQGSIVVIANTGGNVRIYDVSDPVSPLLLSTVAIATGFVAISGDFVYAAAFASTNFNVIDISDPRNPVITGTVNLGGGGLALDVAVERGYAYVAVESSPGRIEIVDILDPANPTIVGDFENSLGGNTNDIAVSGQYLYVGDSLSGGSGIVTCYDVLDPANVTIIDTIDVGQSAESLEPWGPYLLVTDRLAGNLVICSTQACNPVVASRNIEELSCGQLYARDNVVVGSQVTAGDAVVAGQDIYSGGSISARTRLNLAAPVVPATSGDPGSPGDIAWDAQYLYWCVAPNSWVRTPNPGVLF